MRKVRDALAVLGILGVGIPATMLIAEKAACLLDKLLMSAMAI